MNQRNYEESYVDHPDGDDQLDLLILGVHDRNRALHGDVVIVRIKERMNWVVSLFSRTYLPHQTEIDF